MQSLPRWGVGLPSERSKNILEGTLELCRVASVEGVEGVQILLQALSIAITVACSPQKSWVDPLCPAIMFCMKPPGRLRHNIPYRVYVQYVVPR